MNVIDHFNSLKFYNQGIFYKQIDPVARVNLLPIIYYW